MKDQSVLIAILVAVTAVAAAVTSVAHMLSACLKYRNEAKSSPQTMQATSATVHTRSRWARMSLFDRVVAVSNLVMFPISGVALFWLLLAAPVAAATSRDVAMVGVLVFMLVITSRHES